MAESLQKTAPRQNVDSVHERLLAINDSKQGLTSEVFEWTFLNKLDCQSRGPCKEENIYRFS